MNTRTLGHSQLSVSAVGLGCMGMTFSYSPRPDRQAMISLLRAAVDHVDLYGTAVVLEEFGKVMARGGSAWSSPRSLAIACLG